MGEAVSAVVTEIVVAVVVSEVASTIAEKIGLSDNMANLVGIGAAAYVGAARAQEEPHPIFGGGTGGDSPLEAGLPSLQQQQAGGPSATSAPSDVAPSGPAPGAVAGLTDPGGQGPGGTLPAGSGGMLAQGQGRPVGGITPPAQPPQAPKVESTIVPPPSKKTEDSYWSKLFSPERTMDMLLAGIGGAAKAKQAEEDREYPEKIKRQNAADWVSRGTGNLGTLRQSFPGQGYLSNYQQ